MQLFFSSSNPGKIKEIQALFSPQHHIITDSNCPEVIEDASTFIENALRKARQGCIYSKQACLAEDSGLCVPLLNNAPGLYSARYAGENASSKDNILKLTHEISAQGLQQTPGYFLCVMVMLRNDSDPAPIICIGKCHGMVSITTKGSSGYDPIFYLPEQNKYMAELSIAQKNQLSARAHASKAMLQALQ